MSDLLYAYTDETGNTGSKISDTPPYFWTGTLMSPVDLDVLAKAAVGAWANSFGMQELHGSVLGVGRIETFASDLQELLIANNCRLLFTRVEKAHVARVKFADTILDSGLNPAVSLFHYGIRFFRLTHALAIAGHMSPRSVSEFWQAYLDVDVPLFRKLTERVLWNVNNKVPDARLRQLVGDALAWAVKHGDKLLIASRDEFDSPNMVAFSLLLACINRSFQGSDTRIMRFIHDQQNEFARHMEFMYKHLKGVTPATSGATSFMTDLAKSSSIQGSLEISKSNHSIGLQLVDVVLWLVKRHIEHSAITAPSCLRLLDYIRETGAISEFSLISHLEEVKVLRDEVMRLPLNEEDLARGREFLVHMESKRKMAMSVDPPTNLD